MASFTNMSSAIPLDTLIPGYGLFHNLMMQTVGFDATRIIVSVTIAIYVLRALSRVWRTLWDTASAQIMSEIHLSSSDKIYGHLLHFLARQSRLKESRRLNADSIVMGDDDSSRSTGVVTNLSVEGVGLCLYNFSNQRASTLLRYTPAFGDFMIRHRGRTFWLSRKELSSDDESNGVRLPKRPQESLKISCFGRSPQPIKDLIQAARNNHFLECSQSTIIRRPASKSARGYSTGSSWLTVAHRPSRPLETIALDPAEKIALLKDINDYLDPASAQWYANRGIPYRRGYLFHGPPGTGKTSVTFALAGLFGLDIHVVSLLDPSLTEDELAMLFTHLPTKSIILLEDIDSAGISRPFTVVGPEPNEVGSQGSSGSVVTMSMRAPPQVGRRQTLEQGNGISLSSLLNIIDGVASKEGRVLIMTTNYPDRLDEALVRPGRIDYQIAFALAKTTQIKELFTRMYMRDYLSEALSAHRGNQSGIGETKSIDFKPDEDVMRMASIFARKIPSGRFSPAVIQGYLLKYKNNPTGALADAEMWVRDRLASIQHG